MVILILHSPATGIALSLRTPQLWGLLEASEQHPMSLFSWNTAKEGCVVSTSWESVFFTTFDHQLGRCIPGWWDSLWRSSGGTYGTLRADRCAGCADVGRHLSVGKIHQWVWWKKLGITWYHLKWMFFCTPSYFSDFTADFFFSFVWWQSSVPGLLHPFIYTFLEQLDRLRSIQAWPLHFTFEDSTHPPSLQMPLLR